MTVDLQPAIDALEEDIVFGRRHPRERLLEDELMARFGLSRHAVREVLAALHRLGLVERRRNVGALVRSFSEQQVAELYALRELLEAEAARLIPMPVPEAELHPLQQIQRRFDAAVKRGDAPAVFRANGAFHEALFGLCGNATLRAAIAGYARQTQPIRFASLLSPGCREQAAAGHHAMLDALARGDRRSLVATCRAHLRPSRDAYLAAQRARAQNKVA